MPKKRKQQAAKQEGSATDEAGPSGSRAAGQLLHREEALALVAKQTRRNLAEAAERLEGRIQQDKERMGLGWSKNFVDEELDGDPALLYWITVRGHKADEWFVTLEEFEKRRELAQWKGAHRATFAVVSFEEDAVQARKVAHSVAQAAKAEAHFQKQVAADRERKGLSVA
ncbi:diaminopimelate epimerase [Chlorella sorokiniana]|uniref:Diaminopimelate epimerase n=1 Tax=Chlorella sorokiniana TaxID=3076 RepID=A0A2P6TQ53_CHLSO|nr:diaminopimelate epimerase [Chlorella sorokiniana]|eukprot:PRW56159.1 diaminopimelate epimerase [Chlorella sorokiniana]